MIGHCLDLASAVNRVGATFDGDRPAGDMNAWGNSYPAEELPFGGQVLVGGVQYALVRKTSAVPPQPDHVEALGQRLPVGPPAQPAGALALLAAGEMGPQELTLRVHYAAGNGGASADAGRSGGPGSQVHSVAIPGWLTRPEEPIPADQLRCSHQHYPGDYGLALLVPVLWSRAFPLTGAVVTAIELMPNPLVHVFAISLLPGVGS